MRTISMRIAAQIARRREHLMQSGLSEDTATLRAIGQTEEVMRLERDGARFVIGTTEYTIRAVECVKRTEKRRKAV
jgi:hypothetical protein